MDTYTQAACRKTPKINFFPSNEDGPKAEPAKAVCAVCPIKQRCRNDAIARNERAGIWGGLSTKERKPLCIAAGTFNFGRWSED